MCHLRRTGDMLKVTSQLLTDKTRGAQHHMLPLTYTPPPPAPLVTDHSDPEWRGGENYGTHSLPSSCLPRAPAGKSGTAGQAGLCSELPQSPFFHPDQDLGQIPKPSRDERAGRGKGLSLTELSPTGSHPQLSPVARAGKAFFPQPA